jgi:hypothetical protein
MRSRFTRGGGNPNADPRGTGEAFRRRGAFPFADPGAVRVERRVHALAAGPQQKEFEARIKDLGAQLAKRHGMTRRKFFKTAGGMAAAFAAMNEVHAKGGEPIYHIEKSEYTNLDVAPKAFVAQREAVGKAGWNPALAGKPQTIQDLMFPNYFKEIFLDSDTKVACVSGSYSVDESFSFLTNQMKFDTTKKRETRKPSDAKGRPLPRFLRAPQSTR